MRTTITMITAALVVSLSPVSMASDSYGATPYAIMEEMVQAVCDGDMEAYKATHNQDIRMRGSSKELFSEFHEECEREGIASMEVSSSLPESKIQELKRIGMPSVNIQLNNGQEYSAGGKIVWSAFRPPRGAEEGVQAWRIAGSLPVLPRKPNPVFDFSNN